MAPSLTTITHQISPVPSVETGEAFQTNGDTAPILQIGFVEKKAYFSSLTYHLARGETTPVSEIACPICRKNAETHGWCEADKVGRVGNVAIDTKEDYEQVAKAIQIVQAADESAERCKYCATSIISDSRCPFCRITYKDGEPVPPKKD